jgi:hypothetical protein
MYQKLVFDKSSVEYWHYISGLVHLTCKLTCVKAFVIPPLSYGLKLLGTNLIIKIYYGLYLVFGRPTSYTYSIDENIHEHRLHATIYIYRVHDSAQDQYCPRAADDDYSL